MRACWRSFGVGCTSSGLCFCVRGHKALETLECRFPVFASRAVWIGDQVQPFFVLDGPWLSDLAFYVVWCRFTCSFAGTWRAATGTIGRCSDQLSCLSAVELWSARESPVDKQEGCLRLLGFAPLRMLVCSWIYVTFLSSDWKGLLSNCVGRWNFSFLARSAMREGRNENRYRFAAARQTFAYVCS